MSSYYDDPATKYHAQIASQKSIIIDYKYSYDKNLNIINNTPPESIPTHIYNEQIQIVQNIQNTLQTIYDLQNQLVNINSNIEIPPSVTDLSNNIVQPPVTDLSGN